MAAPASSSPTATGYALVAVLGGIGLIALLAAMHRRDAADDYEEFELQHYRAAGFTEPTPGLARDLVTWTIGMVAIGLGIREAPELIAALEKP